VEDAIVGASKVLTDTQACLIADHGGDD